MAGAWAGPADDEMQDLFALIHGEQREEGKALLSKIEKYWISIKNQISFLSPTDLVSAHDEGEYDDQMSEMKRLMAAAVSSIDEAAEKYRLEENDEGNRTAPRLIALKDPLVLKVRNYQKMLRTRMAFLYDQKPAAGAAGGGGGPGFQIYQDPPADTQIPVITKEKINFQERLEEVTDAEISTTAKVPLPDSDGRDDEDSSSSREKLKETLAANGVKTSDKCDIKGIVIINHGNPTGQFLTWENIEAVIKLAGEKKFHSFKKVMYEMGAPYNGLEVASFMTCSKGYMGECGVRGGYAEVINMDLTVFVMLLPLISAKLCPTVVGQACMDVVVNPSLEGDPSFSSGHCKVRNVGNEYDQMFDFTIPTPDVLGLIASVNVDLDDEPPQQTQWSTAV